MPSPRPSRRIATAPSSTAWRQPRWRRSPPLTDAKAKKEHTKALDEAKKVADKLRFGDAKAALQQIEVKIDEGKLKSAAAANPGDPQILAIARKMAANGGGKTLDALIKGQPDNADPRILTALAEGRYGMAFSVDPSADPKNEMKSMKAVCEMFSKIPQDIVGNTSITKVSHKDTTDGSVGGGYTPASGAIGMTGRPKIAEQKFGSALSKTKDGKPISELPGKIDPECQPANEKKVDFLAFAAAHEVGHGVDDSKSFMAKNGGKAAFGGWIEHGANMQPVADVVGPHFKFYSTPEQKEYVLSTLLSKPTTTPPVPSAPGDWAKCEAGLRRLVRDRERRRSVVEPVEVGRDHHRRSHLPAGLHPQLGQLRRLGAQQGPHRLPVPRARRMVRRALRRLPQRQARQEAPGPRVADQALIREAPPCRSSGPTNSTARRATRRSASTS